MFRCAPDPKAAARGRGDDDDGTTQSGDGGEAAVGSLDAAATDSIRTSTTSTGGKPVATSAHASNI